MAEEKDYENLSDEELDEKINQTDEEEPSEEPETEEAEEDSKEDEEETVDIEELEKDETEAEPEESETEEAEETAEEKSGRFKSQEDAEKAYQNLLQLQLRQSNELGELRKQVNQIQKPVTETKPAEQEQIDPEKLADLIVDDPAKALEYITSKAEERITQKQQMQKEQSEREQTIQTTNQALLEFASLEDNKQMTENEFVEFGTFLYKTFNMPKGGYTVDTLKKYHSWMNSDTVIQKKVEDAKRQTLKKVSESSPKVKTLSTAQNAKAKAKVDLSKMRFRDEVESAAEQISDEELEEQINSL